MTRNQAITKTIKDEHRATKDLLKALSNYKKATKKTMTTDCFILSLFNMEVDLRKKLRLLESEIDDLENEV